MNAKIQVGIRLRPFLESELGKGYTNTKIKVDKPQGKISVFDSHSNNNRVFEFDHIFDQPTTQRQIYEECKVTEMVARVLDGFHSTIFAYGQTGSGKTYTMEGKHENGNYVSDEMKGIVVRSFDDLFTMIPKLKANTKKDYNVTCSFLQIYNEKIYDLLSHHSQFAKNSDPTNQAGINQQQAAAVAAAGYAPQGLKLRWNAREQFQVENLFVFDVKNPKEAYHYFLQGVKNRITASHKLNMTSSRSHTIFTVTVHTYSEQGAHETTSKLQLVDLAGSERIALTGTEGKMAKESIDINKSLFTLRQVITALSEINQTSGGNGFNSTAPLGLQGMQNTQANQLLSTQQMDPNAKIQHIPYRDSKLTSLLKQSIGGNCYCLMMACIVPNDSFSDENISTLHYASRATYIKNQPVKNEDPNKQILAEVNKQNSNLKSELERANAHIAFLTAALEKSEKNNAFLKQQNAELLKQLENKPQTGGQASSTEGKDPNIMLTQTATSFQIGGQSEQLIKEQMFFQQQQEQFRVQQQAQIQQQKQFEQQMLKFQQSGQKFNELDASSATTAFHQAHNYEAFRQSGGLQNFQNQNQNQNMKQTGVGFIRHSAADTPTGASSMKNQQNTFSANQQQSNAGGNENNKVYYTQMDYDNFSDRLIESITLVRQLLESNKELRQQTDEYKMKSHSCEQELADLTAENQELRDQLDNVLSQKGVRITRKTTSQKGNRRIQSGNNSSDRINDGEDSEQNQEDSDYSQLSPQVVKEGDQEKPQKSNFGNMPPRYPKKKKTENNQLTDEQEISDIKELVHEENMETQQAEMSVSSLQKTIKNSTQPARGKSINSSDGMNNSNYQGQTKNELIQEILELRHNQLVLEKKIKSYDVDRSQLRSQQGQSSTTGNSHIISSGVLSSNSAGKNQQQMTPNSKQNYTFYSTTKKRGQSQNQSSLPRANHNNLSMQLQDDFQPSQTLHATPNTATSSINNTKAVIYLNRTQQDFNVGQGYMPSSTTASSGQQASIDAALYTNRQGLDSIPTNFGRFTYYQQNFHNLEKLSTQQMAKFQQAQNQSMTSSAQVNQTENQKFNTTGRNTLSNIATQQYQEYTNELPLQLNDQNPPNTKRITSSGIPSVKAKRSNSLTKNQINVIQSNPTNFSNNITSINNANQKAAYDFYQGNVGKDVNQGINSNPSSGITYTKLKNVYPNNNNLPLTSNTSSNDENQNKPKYTPPAADPNKLKSKASASQQQRKLSISNN